MVQEERYTGLDEENPIEHLHRFERLMRTTTKGGESQDVINLTLFPFSLDGEAARWEEDIETSTILTWEDCRRSFMKKFYTTQRKERIRQHLMRFKQGCVEELHDAWDRFCRYVKQCPFHGIKEGALLTTFHNGLIPRYHEMLNVASGGSFADLEIDKGRTLIEKLCQSGRCYQGSYVSELGNLQTKQEMDDIREQLFAINQRLNQKDQFMESKRSRSSSPTMSSKREEEVKGMLHLDDIPIHYKRLFEDMCARGKARDVGEAYYKETLTPPQPKESKLEDLLSRIIDVQERGFDTVHSKVDSLAIDTSTKYDEILSKVEAYESSCRKLLEKNDEKEDFETKAIELRSGRALPPREKTTAPKESSKGKEKIVYESNEKDCEQEDLDIKTEEKNNPTFQEGPIKKKVTFAPNLEKNLPFPGRFKKTIIEKSWPTFKDLVSQIQVTVPFADLMLQHPT